MSCNIISQMKKYIILLCCVLFFLCPGALYAQSSDAPSRYVYAVVAPFDTLTDGISFTELGSWWNGSKTTDWVLPGKLLICAENAADLTEIFGGDPSSDFVIQTKKADIVEECLNEGFWAVIPFELIEPRLKVLTIDGDSVISNQFDVDAWPLTAKHSNTDRSDIDWSAVPIINRDAEKLTTMILTGVTAMVRATASYMDAISPLYPGSNIRLPLINADILHVNNEVPFARVCSQTQEELDTLHFCSKSSYLDLLTDIGTDVIELDGDHFQDYGDEAVLYTLDLYKNNGLQYYGGGVNKEEAQKPLIVEHNGNSFGFIGCNGKELGYAAASETRPGAVHCDINLINKQIAQLKSEGIIPIVTFQHIEIYQDMPNQDMIDDFESVRNAGAVIVSGSQSHIPMKFDMYTDSFIHYGLGNLFFDQAFFLPETATATLDRHIFYAGKYISTEFLTIRFTNCALSQYMDADDRNTLLTRMFASSSVEK